MSFLITDSKTPLLMETVPVLKLTHFYGALPHGMVYAYVRCFACKGALHVCFTEFDENPVPTAYLALYLQAPEQESSYLSLTVRKHGGAALQMCAAATGAAVQTLACEQPAIVTGGDEQGLFWSARVTLTADTLRKTLGKAPKAGDFILGNVLMLDETAPHAAGAAFPLADGALTAGFDTFTFVPY